jgi:hypothetical protein
MKITIEKTEIVTIVVPEEDYDEIDLSVYGERAIVVTPEGARKLMKALEDTFRLFGPETEGYNDPPTWEEKYKNAFEGKPLPRGKFPKEPTIGPCYTKGEGFGEEEPFNPDNDGTAIR